MKCVEVLVMLWLCKLLFGLICVWLLLLLFGGLGMLMFVLFLLLDFSIDW